MISFIRNKIYKVVKRIYGDKVDKLYYLLENLSKEELSNIKNSFINSERGQNVKIYSPYKILNSKVGDYTYIAQNPTVRLTTIGKFCSIGANFVCGWGIHPTNGISTSPMFYSTQKQNGMTLSSIDKIEEVKPIVIGNDVYIGMNVTILDGVTIGDGAVIGAGCIVSKDIPPYAIVVGNSVKIIRYRFTDNIIKELQYIKWWDWDISKLKEVEKYFFNIDEFVKKFGDNITHNE